MAKPLRIFISSPGDVDEERRRAALVVSRLKREFVRFFDLSAILWEYEPMLSSGHFQDIIDPPSTADIVVLILWSRLGTPLPERTATREYKRRDGQAPVTGTEWEYEEALAAREKSGTPDLLVYRKFSDGFARFSRAEQLDEIRRQWEALQTFWQRHFETPDGQFKAAFNRFQSLDEFEAQLEAHLRELLRRRLPAQGARLAHGTGQAKIDWWSGSPYAGLKAFDVEQAAIFFGRERAEREITENLVRHATEGTGLMLVLGASGSGKSSVVRAGVLPDLMASGVVAEVSTWRYAIMQPGELASDPFAGLAAALMRPQGLPELAGMGYQVTDIAAQLAGDPTLAVMPLRLALERAAENDKNARGGLRRGRLVLVLDQLEVLFTSDVVNEAILSKVDALLAKLAQSGLVWIVATLRSDFYHRLVDLPQLNALATGIGQYLLAPPGAAEIEQIIRGPADVAGLSFEIDEKTGIGLDASIREAASRDPASLPLLSFVLDELYRRDVEAGGGNILTFKSYRELGGLEGAIAHHADDLLAGLSEELASALPALLLSLVDIDEVKSLVTARAVQFTSLTNPLHVELASRLVAARLAVADDTGVGRTLRFAHEALLTNWPTLTNLVEQHRDFLIVRRRLHVDTVAWQRHERHADFLLPPGRRLAEAEEALAQRGDQLDPEIRTFAETSIAAERERQAAIQRAKEEGLRRELRRSRRIAAVVSLLLLLAVTAGYIAWQQKREAERSYQLALDQAAGSIEMLVEGYDQGAVASKMMQQLMERSQRTVSGLSGEGDDLTAARVQLLDVLSLANLTVGRGAKAREFAEQENALAGRLLAKDPRNVTWRQLGAVAQVRLAEALAWQGDFDNAITRARAGQAELIELTKDNLDERLLWQLVLAYQRIGDALRSQGQLDSAEKEYRAWLDLGKRLESRQPVNPLWQRAIGFAYQRLGDNLLTQDRPVEAAQHLRDYQAQMTRLATAYPENMIFLEGLTFSHQRLGDALFAQNDNAGALKQYRSYQESATKLFQVDASNFRWQELSQFTHQRLGEVALRGKDYDGALKEFRIYLALVEDARKKDPENNATLYSVSNAYEKVGDALRERGDLAGALRAYQSQKEVAERLASKANSHATWQKSLATSYQRIGLVFRMQGETAKAVEHFQKCATIPAKSTAWTPRSTWPRDVPGDCLRQLAELGAAAK
jgi:tetratricopeptide (TPR) repeat protein